VPDNKAIVRRLFDELWSKGQLPVIDELVSKDFIGYWPFRGEPVKGPLEYKDMVEEIRKAFPDQTMKVLDEIAEGDRVATRFEVSGTHRGEFLTVPATNKALRVEGFSMSRIKNGKIVETRVQMDTIALMRELGIVSPKIVMPVPTLTR